WMIGYTREELASGQVNWRRLTPPEYAAADAHAIAQLKATGVCAPFEKEYIRKDGRRVPVLMGMASLEGSQDLCIAYTHDITERKAAEGDRARTEALLMAAIEQTPAGVIIADAPDARIRIANSVALGIRGESPYALTEIPINLHPVHWQM